MALLIANTDEEDNLDELVEEELYRIFSTDIGPSLMNIFPGSGYEIPDIIEKTKHLISVCLPKQ